MKVRFEFTIDDLIDVGERSLSASRVVTKLRRTAVVVWALFAGVVFWAILPLSPTFRIAAAVGAAAGAALFYPGFRKKEVHRRLREVWRERLAGDGPFVCEVELDDAGVTTEQLGTKTSQPWRVVASVAEKPDSVEIATEKGGLVVVRDRAFASPEEKSRFLEFARARLWPPRPKT